MPPKPRITREQIIDAALELTESLGAEYINARTVAEKLKCSTQPVMYHFRTIEELKKAVYEKIDLLHTEYLMNIEAPQADEAAQDDMMLGIGLNYIRFAVEKPKLFRFLFQSGFAKEHSLLEMIDSEELMPVIGAMQAMLGMDTEQTKAVFTTIALFAHGYASIIANNSLDYDEELIAAHLDRAYRGAVAAVHEDAAQEERKGESG